MSTTLKVISTKVADPYYHEDIDEGYKEISIPLCPCVNTIWWIANGYIKLSNVTLTAEK